MNEKLQIFKKYSKDKKFYNLPTCHDPLTAKLIEKKGFKAKIKIESGINELINVFSNTKENIVNNY